MEQFLPIPHCPTKKVTLCAVGEEFPQVREQLVQQKIEIFTVPVNPKLSDPVKCHPDLQLGVLAGDRIAIGKGERGLQKRLVELGFTTIESEFPLSSHYPQEAVLDFVSLDDRIIGHEAILRKNRLLNNSQTIDVKQGYTKCNAAIITQRAMITSDPSIANACRANNMDVLLIRSGFIELPGYDTGFIGGCCGLIAADQLAVCGDLHTHPDCECIHEFLHKYNVSVLQLADGTLKDIGGIIPLKQSN